jgi:hypothetical protein
VSQPDGAQDGWNSPVQIWNSIEAENLCMGVGKRGSDTAREVGDLMAMGQSRSNAIIAFQGKYLNFVSQASNRSRKEEAVVVPLERNSMLNWLI